MDDLSERLDSLRCLVEDRANANSELKRSQDEDFRDRFPEVYEWLDSLSDYRQPGRLFHGSRVLLIGSGGNGFAKRSELKAVGLL